MVWACFQPQGVSPSNRQCLAVRASVCHACGGQGVERSFRQPCRRPEGPAQLGVDKAQPEFRRAVPGKAGRAGRKQGGKGRFVQRGEEVQLHGGLFRATARGQKRRTAA